MNYEVVLDLIFIFIFYSFIGWLLEVITIIIKERRFVNRGITNGPLCTLYGVAALLVTVIARDSSNLLAIFFTSMIYGTGLELIAGKLLERTNRLKWWDYSDKPWNLDGYICLQYSLLWGFLGVLLIKIGNPIFVTLFHSLYPVIKEILLFILLGIIAIDLLTSFITLKSLKENKLENVTNRFGNWLLRSILKRLENAYPNIKKEKKKQKEKSKVFAQGTSFYKLFWIFLIGGFIGDLCEILFCRYSMHRWMSRSSFVFSQISIVWGIAFFLATLLLHRYQKKSNTFLFFFGTIMGGAFEYCCSVFTEFFFGTVFWDYSKFAFNIHGRVNLLFCFFWGFATVLFIKVVYPFLSKTIERIPRKMGIILTNVFFFLLLIDCFVTGCVMMRYRLRTEGKPAENVIEELCDSYADDEFMMRRWPNMKQKKID